MKQEFGMTQQNMDDIIAINKNNCNVVMKIGDYTTSNNLAESVNRYWEILGEKMGFKHMTVEGSSRGKLFFLAEPKPVVVPKTQAEIEMDKYDSLQKIVEQLEFEEHECVAGSLQNSVAFMALKKMANLK